MMMDTHFSIHVYNEADKDAIVKRAEEDWPLVTSAARRITDKCVNKLFIVQWLFIGLLTFSGPSSKCDSCNQLKASLKHVAVLHLPHDSGGMPVTGCRRANC